MAGTGPLSGQWHQWSRLPGGSSRRLGDCNRICLCQHSYGYDFSVRRSSYSIHAMNESFARGQEDNAPIQPLADGDAQATSESPSKSLQLHQHRSASMGRHVVRELFSNWLAVASLIFLVF